jgi:hypothetical protein
MYGLTRGAVMVMTRIGVATRRRERCLVPLVALPQRDRCCLAARPAGPRR